MQIRVVKNLKNSQSFICIQYKPGYIQTTICALDQPCFSTLCTIEKNCLSSDVHNGHLLVLSCYSMVCTYYLVLCTSMYSYVFVANSNVCIAQENPKKIKLGTYTELSKMAVIHSKPCLLPKYQSPFYLTPTLNSSSDNVGFTTMSRVSANILDIGSTLNVNFTTTYYYILIVYSTGTYTQLPHSFA